MIRRGVRRCAALVAAGALVVAAAGCGGSSLNDAATVTVTDKSGEHVTHITRDEFTKQLKQLTGNAQFLKALADNQSPIGSGSSTDSRFSAYWLTQLINTAGYDAAFKDRHLVLDDAARSQAQQAAEQNFGGAAVFQAFPTSLRNSITDGYARAITLANSVVKNPTEAEAQAYFEAHKDQFACASGKDVAHILVADQAKANALMAQLKAGANFAQLAAANSTDTGSAQQGGALGCLKPGAFVTEFQTAADAAPLGTPVGPVKSQYGYHLILVTPAGPVTYASVRDQVAQALQQQSQAAAGTAILAVLKKLHVKVDPRYGTWTASTNSTGQTTYVVRAPTAPTVRNTRETTTSTGNQVAPTTGVAP